VGLKSNERCVFMEDGHLVGCERISEEKGSTRRRYRVLCCFFFCLVCADAGTQKSTKSLGRSRRFKDPPCSSEVLEKVPQRHSLDSILGDLQVGHFLEVP
jgi:hypothetical protein